MVPKFFSLFEFLYSSTAEKYKISNIPTFEQVDNLLQLGFFLDGIREKWGSGIDINSGFRCQLLNEKVGGSKTSAHMTGFAADLYPKNGKFEDFKNFIIDYLKDKKYDQCIVEKSGKSQWIHLGLFNSKGEQRKQCFKIEK